MPVPSNTSGSDVLSMVQPAPRHATVNTAGILKAPTEPFLLRHHPSQWEVASEGLKGPTLLPVIGLHVLVPGAMGNRTRNKGEPVDATYKNAKRDAEDKGWTYFDEHAELDDKHRPEGMPTGGYLRMLPCRNPLNGAEGEYYFEAWSRPHPAIPGELQGFAFDHASYNRWRAWLVASGKVRKPSPGIHEALDRRYGQRVRRVQAQNIPQDLRKERVAEAKTIHKAHADAKVPAASDAAKQIEGGK